MPKITLLKGLYEGCIVTITAGFGSPPVQRTVEDTVVEVNKKSALTKNNVTLTDADTLGVIIRRRGTVIADDFAGTLL